MSGEKKTIDLKKGIMYIFGKSLRIGMEYEEVKQSFVEVIEHNNVYNDSGGACVTLQETEIYGVPGTVEIYFANYFIRKIMIYMDPNCFYEEVQKNGGKTWEDTLRYGARIFSSSMLAEIPTQYIRVKKGEQIYCKGKNYQIDANYNRDMIQYIIVFEEVQAWDM